MTHPPLLLAAALALAIVPTARDAAADPPVAPPPREKRPTDPAVVEEFGRLWAEKRALLLAGLRRAEAEADRAAAERERADARFAGGRATAGQRDALRAREEAALQAAELYRRDVRADEERHREALSRTGFAPGSDPSEITGTLAVDVTFPAAARPRAAAAARGLVEAATDALYDTPEAWNAALRLPHVRVRFPAPPAFVPIEGGWPVALDDVLVPLPLTRDPGGYVLVRERTRVVRFTKYPYDTCVRFQEALAAAVPAGR